MITKIYENIYIANDKEDKSSDYSWISIRAAKYPWHNELTGGVSNKSSPEYLFARRGNSLILNLVDAEKPEFISKICIDKAIEMMELYVSTKSIVVQCNEGFSRSPSIVFLYLVKNKIITGDLKTALASFYVMYPKYRPGKGMFGFIKNHFEEYRNG